MTFAHFYDLNGNPITGKSPIQIRVTGGKLKPASQAGVQAFLNSFLGKARVSVAEKHQQTITLADGTKVEASSTYGVVAVTVEVPPDPVVEDNPLEEFVGGILIRPEYCIDESVMFGPDRPNFDTPRTLVPEVSSRGKTVDKPGRPAVPGVASTESTDWLVVQIARDKPLDVEPVKRGAVRIWRLTNPLFGPRVEVNSTPGRYLLSANFSLTEFYICGKRAEYLPPLPLTDEERGVLEEVCIRTVGFTPLSFKRANKTDGIVIVAVDRKLFAIDTLNRPPAGMPTWQLLDIGIFDAPLRYLNQFGTTFTQVRAPGGALTVTCSGSNGAGVCSGFQVVITPVPNGRPTLSGLIYPMHDGSEEAVPGERTYRANLAVSGTVFQGFSASVYLSSPTPGPLPATHRGASIEYSVQRNLSEGSNELRYDRFLGGAIPRYSSGAQSSEVVLSSLTTFNDWLLGVVVETPLGSGVFSQAFAARFGSSEELTMVTTQAGDTSDMRTTDIEFSVAREYIIGSTDPDYVSPYTTSYTRTTSGVVTELPCDPVLEWQYTGVEQHVGALAWRRRAARTAERTPFGTESGSPTLAADPLSSARVYVPSEVEETTEFSALELTSQLIRRSGTAVVNWTDAFERFDETPVWAGPQTATVDGGEKFAMLSYRTGPDETPPDVLGYAAYSEWFPAIHLVPYAVEVGTYPFGGYFAAGAPLIPTGSTPTGDPGISEFSYSYTFDGSEPASFSLADFIAFQPQTVYAYGVTFGTLPTTVTVTVPSGPAGGPNEDKGGVAAPLLADLAMVDRVLYDLRTGGFIAESTWYHEHATDDWRTSAETFIGNDVSCVPLRQVLDEWRALGQLDGATDDKYIFAIKPDAPAVALL